MSYALFYQHQGDSSTLRSLILSWTGPGCRSIGSKPTQLSPAVTIATGVDSASEQPLTAGGTRPLVSCVFCLLGGEEGALHGSMENQVSDSHTRRYLTYNHFQSHVSGEQRDNEGATVSRKLVVFIWRGDEFGMLLFQRWRQRSRVKSRFWDTAIRFWLTLNDKNQSLSFGSYYFLSVWDWWYLSFMKECVELSKFKITYFT